MESQEVDRTMRGKQASEDQLGEDISLRCSTSTNLTVDDVDEATLNKLRGDAIGSTMYSEFSVLKILLQLENLNWCKDVEDDLCLLWDMTVEDEICQYLFKVEFPTLADSALQRYDENRFVEIVIGICANLLTSNFAKDNSSCVKVNEVATVLDIMLNTDDPLILIQIVRFVHGIVHTGFDIGSMMDENIFNQICFILSNSTNEDLLLHTLKAVSSLTSNFSFRQQIVKAELIEATVLACRTIAENEHFSQQHISACNHFIQITTNLCYLAQNMASSELINNLKQYSSLLIEEIETILEYFSNEENLFPMSDVFVFYMEAMPEIFKILSIKYNPKVMKHICKIMFLISKRDCPEFVSCSELFCYCLSTGNPELILRDCNRVYLLDVVNRLKDLKLSLDFDYTSNLKNIFTQDTPKTEIN